MVPVLFPADENEVVDGAKRWCVVCAKGDEMYEDPPLQVSSSVGCRLPSLLNWQLYTALLEKVVEGKRGARGEGISEAPQLTKSCRPMASGSQLQWQPFPLVPYFLGP